MWGDSLYSNKHRKVKRIRRRAGLGGASERRTDPQRRPGTGTRPRRWHQPPRWCWRPGRAISPRLPLRSGADSPTEEEENNTIMLWHDTRKCVKCHLSKKAWQVTACHEGLCRLESLILWDIKLVTTSLYSNAFSLHFSLTPRLETFFCHTQKKKLLFQIYSIYPKRQRQSNIFSFFYSNLSAPGQHKSFLSLMTEDV